MNYKSRIPEGKTAKILSVVERFTTIWNEKDQEKFGTIFTEDAEFTDVTGQTALGRLAIVKQHEYPFATVNKNAVLSIKDLMIRNLSETLVIVSGQWSSLGSQTPKGDPLPERKGIIQIICELVNEEWLIKLVYNNDIQTLFFRENRDLTSH